MEIIRTWQYLYPSESFIDLEREQIARLGGTLFKISLMCLKERVRYF